MVVKKVTVKHRQGLHARPATEFVKLASAFKCDITIEYNGKKFDAKDMFALLSSGIEYLFEINLCCNGEDEVIALEKLSGFVESGEVL